MLPRWHIPYPQLHLPQEKSAHGISHVLTTPPLTHTEPHPYTVHGIAVPAFTEPGPGAQDSLPPSSPY